MGGIDDRDGHPVRGEDGRGHDAGWSPGWMLYRLVVAAVLLLAAPVLLARRGRHYLPTVRGRLGLAPGDPPSGAPGAGPRKGGRPSGRCWIHAVSVGEVGVAATLARRLPASEPALITTITPTGQERARAAFHARSTVAYLPFDLASPVRRFFRRFEPRSLVLVEGDYWPLVLRETARRGLPIAVVNGRVGDRSDRRMTRIRSLPGPLGRVGRRLLRLLFDPVDRFGVQTDEDRRRLIALGVAAERVTVTGNLKYETPEPRLQPQVEQLLRSSADGRPVLVAGSTMPGEEERVLEAFVGAGGGERALLVLAPRHPERWDGAAESVARVGLRALRRSAFDDRLPGDAPAGPPAPAGRPDVLLLDSLGELAGLYRVATGAFIGGTLVPTGGHNPLEAAVWGTPVAVGPSMENFRQIAAEFDRREAWARVSDPAGLAAIWHRWLDDPAQAARTGARGQELIERNRGALEKTVEMLSELEVVS